MLSVYKCNNGQKTGSKRYPTINVLSVFLEVISYIEKRKKEKVERRRDKERNKHEKERWIIFSKFITKYRTRSGGHLRQTAAHYSTKLFAQFPFSYWRIKEVCQAALWTPSILSL